MTEMEAIGEAVLAKVRGEVEGILTDARSRADGVRAAARSRLEARLRDEREKMLAEARSGAVRLTAQSAIAARQELLLAKNEVIDGIFKAAGKSLADAPSTADALRGLIEEGIAVLGVERVKVLLAHRDAVAVRKLVATDRQWGARIVEVGEAPCSGGAIVEDPEGKLRIDNTYETRLQMLRPTLMQHIAGELFQE